MKPQTSATLPTHTPGPWEQATGIMPHDCPGLAIVADGLIIARVEHHISDLEIARSNARLIAAAPEMGVLLRELQHEQSLSATQVRKLQDVLVKAGLL